MDRQTCPFRVPFSLMLLAAGHLRETAGWIASEGARASSTYGQGACKKSCRPRSSAGHAAGQPGQLGASAHSCVRAHCFASAGVPLALPHKAHLSSAVKWQNGGDPEALRQRMHHDSGFTPSACPGTTPYRFFQLSFLTKAAKASASGSALLTASPPWAQSVSKADLIMPPSERYPMLPLGYAMKRSQGKS